MCSFEYNLLNDTQWLTKIVYTYYIDIGMYILTRKVNYNIST